MAEYESRKERRKAVRKYEKRRVATETKTAQAEKRREEYKKKAKQDKKAIKRADDKKTRQEAREKLEKHRSKAKAEKQTVKRTTKRAERITKKRDKAANWSTTKQGTPGVKNDVIQPFMTADQIAEQADRQNSFNEQMSNLDFALKNMIADTGFRNSEIDKQHTANIQQENESAASRGLFHSSIRDAGLFDVDATAATMKSDNLRALDTLEADNERQKLMANQAMTAYQSALQKQMVQNAMEASKGMEEYKIDPTKDQQIAHSIKVPKIKPPKRPNKPGNGQHQSKPEKIGGAVDTSGGVATNNPGGGPTGPRPNVGGSGY